jgi:hypothetical protein
VCFQRSALDFGRGGGRFEAEDQQEEQVTERFSTLAWRCHFCGLCVLAFASRKLAVRSGHICQFWKSLVSTRPYTVAFHVSQDLPPHERRLCRMLNRAKSTTAAPVHAVTTEKLLEASLTTLETMGRHMHVAGTQSILMGNEDGMFAALSAVNVLWCGGLWCILGRVVGVAQYMLECNVTLIRRGIVLQWLAKPCLLVCNIRAQLTFLCCRVCPYR